MVKKMAMRVRSRMRQQIRFRRTNRNMAVGKIGNIACDKPRNAAIAQGAEMLHRILKVFEGRLQSIRDDGAVNRCQRNKFEQIGERLNHIGVGREFSQDVGDVAER